MAPIRSPANTWHKHRAHSLDGDSDQTLPGGTMSDERACQSLKQQIEAYSFPENLLIFGETMCDTDFAHSLNHEGCI